MEAKQFGVREGVCHYIFMVTPLIWQLSRDRCIQTWFMGENQVFFLSKMWGCVCTVKGHFRLLVFNHSGGSESFERFEGNRTTPFGKECLSKSRLIALAFCTLICTYIHHLFCCFPPFDSCFIFKVYFVFSFFKLFFLLQLSRAGYYLWQTSTKKLKKIQFMTSSGNTEK